MRVGPSRLISTADVSGESNDTVAAEWMTMSALANDRPVGVAEAEPVGADVAGDRGDAAIGHRPEGLAARVAVVRAARRRSKASFLSSSFCVAYGRRRALAVAHEQDQLAVGNAPQQAFDERRPDEPGGSGDGDALAGERFCDHNGLVYHLVETSATMSMNCPDPTADPRRRPRPVRRARRRRRVARRDRPRGRGPQADRPLLVPVEGRARRRRARDRSPPSWSW